MATVMIGVELPQLPNFVRLKARAQAGDTSYVDVADLSTSVLSQLGKEWTAALIRHAEHRRKTQSALKKAL